MTNLLTQKEAARFFKWSIWAKPFMIYTLTFALAAMVGTICFLLLMEKSTVSESSGLIIAFCTAITPIIGAIVVGKSYEKVKGASTDEDVTRMASNEPATPSVVEDVPASSTHTLIAGIDPIALMQGDPFSVLNSMNLDDFMPKIADDKPVV